MLSMVESRVHVERKIVFVIKRALAEKLQMLTRNLVLDSLPRTFKIQFAFTTRG